MFNSDIAAQESRLQPDQAFPAGCPAPDGNHRLKRGRMNVECLIRISPLRSPGFSRIRRSQQEVAAPAGIHRLKPGLPVIHIRTIFSSFISGIGRSRQEALSRQASHRLKPGLQDGISGLFL